MSVSELADYASLAGVVIAIGGFVVTIRDVGKARKAAEEARRAAKEAVFRLGEKLLAEDIESTIHLLNEIVSACRGKDWHTAVLRAGDARGRLTRMSNHSSFSANENDDLNLAINGMTRTIKTLETMRKQLAIKDLPTRQFTDLQDAIAQLGRILGRIRSRAFEI